MKRKGIQHCNELQEAGTHKRMTLGLDQVVRKEEEQNSQERISRQFVALDFGCAALGININMTLNWPIKTGARNNYQRTEINNR